MDTITIWTTRPAIAGRANLRVCELVAQALGLRTAAVRIAMGEHARKKVVEIEAPEALVADRLTELLRATPDSNPRGTT